MKRTSICYFSLAAILAGSLVSCQDEDQGFDEYVIRESAILREYQNNFEARYGKSDANHDWGFGEDQPLLRSYANAMTRGFGAPGVDNNRNQWTERDNNGYKDGALARDINVPGWPNFDGYYYTNTGIKSFDEINFSSDQAVGDVTDYEIQYVSHWFRTHRNPTSLDLHLTDFFVQNVSADGDQVYYNGYVNGNGTVSIPTNNQWKNGDNATNTNQVLVDGSKTEKKSSDIIPNVEILSADAYPKTLQYSLDNMQCKPYGKSDFSETLSNDIQTGWTHVNEFNNGTTNINPEEASSTNTRVIKYITSSGTEDFACRSSQATSDPWIHKWVLVHLTWEEVGHDGNTYTREGYYLGFDFKMVQADQVKVDYDGFYSNWIIKITPANFAPTSSAKRVMCEDLGSTFDFDFDDVVFDVAYPSETEALITLHAAGGTLPIYVGKNHPDFEAHYLLGNDKDDYTTPVNVGVGNSHAPAVYRVPCTSATKNAKYIPIYVKQGEKTYVLTGQVPDASDEQYLTTVDSNGNAIAVNGNTYIISENNDPRYNRNGNSAPRRFAVPVDVKWMKETQFIEDGYANFPKWVQSKDWSDDSGRKWYKIVSDPSKLYNNTVVVEN